MPNTSSGFRIDQRHDRGLSSLQIAIAVFVGTFLTMSAWAFSLPIGGGVDEPSHMIRAEAVSRGDLVTDVVDGANNVMHWVSPAVGQLWGQLCFLYDPRLSPSCAPELSSERGPVIAASTGAGRYNPVPYAPIGWVSLAVPGVAGLYLMRMLSAAIIAAFFAAAAWSLAGLNTSPAVRLALAWGLTPMVLALGGIVNPNSVEVGAGLAVFCATVAHVISPGASGGRARVAIIVIAGFFLANARAISPLWLLILGAAALAFAERESWNTLTRMRSTYVAAGASVISAALSTGWTMSVQPLTAGAPIAGVGTPFLEGFITTLKGTFGFAPQWIGATARFPLPDPVLFAVGAVLFALAVAAFVAGNRGGRIAVALLSTAIVLAPTIIQGASANAFGYVWQGRYSLLFIPVLAVASALALAARGRMADAGASWTRVRWMTIVLLVSLQAFSVAFVLKGFQGLGGTWHVLLTAPAWTPPGGVLVWVALAAVGTAITTAALATPARGVAA